MTRSKTILSFRRFRTGVLVGLLAMAAGAEALEFGHVRARTRGFEYRGAADGFASKNGPGTDAVSVTEDTREGELQPMGRSLSYAGLTTEDVRSGGSQLSVEENEADNSPMNLRRRNISRRTKSTPGFFLIGRDREEDLRKLGYLAEGPPNPLRFSDDTDLNRRPTSPALPEFTMISDEYFPYLVESALPMDAMNDPAMLAELVVELEPHEVVSGKIDTTRVVEQQSVEFFELEEQRSSVLRPEEVLIFFETTGPTSNSNAIIPFAPATPSNQTHRSSARLIKE